MRSGPFAAAEDIAHVAHGGERYVPLVDPYNAAMHLGHMASYKHALLYAYDRHVLDVGCGTGYGAHYLASFGARRVAAVDLDKVALEYARAAYPHPGVHFRCCEGQRLSFADGSFDFVVSSQVIEHTPNPKAFLSEISRVLNRQGACLIVAPNRLLFSPDGGQNPNEFHINEMSPDQLEALGRVVFPRVEMAGIPQNCLQVQPDGTLDLKPNALLRLEDYQVQRHNLARCENVLLLGYKEAHWGFATTLPHPLLRASTNLAPCFWDAASKRWVELGLFPSSTAAESQLLGGQRLVRQAFRSPHSHMYRIDIALSTAASTSVVMTLRDHGQDGEALVQKVVECTGKWLSLTFKPIEASAGRWRQRVPQYAYHGGQLSIWTFHQTLPSIVNG
jgi:ubiquinone/menaquinone biosynthesis C-methylase UbiE